MYSTQSVYPPTPIKIKPTNNGKDKEQPETPTKHKTLKDFFNTMNNIIKS